MIIMRKAVLSVTLLSGLLLCAADGSAGTDAVAGAVRMTDKGWYTVTLNSAEKGFQVGVNSLSLAVRDKNGSAAPAAEISLIPWLPAGSHGVWDKPGVTDLGNGNYRVENVMFARTGQWDIRVVIKQGAREDRTVFSVPVGAGAGGRPALDASKNRAKYQRSVEHYRVPPVTLLDENGRQVSLRSHLDSGRPVIIDFVYTTCSTICPILSAGFANLQRRLGADTRGVHLVSISIDPDQDRPDRTKEYLARFEAREGWDFLTGSREAVGQVLKAFDASVRDKMSHSPFYLLRAPHSDEWVRVSGLIGADDLLHELRSIENK